MPDMVHHVFRTMVERFADRPFLGTPPNPERAYAPEGVLWTYAEAARLVDELVERYRAAGWGHGHRLALQIENHPVFFVHRLALQELGASLVPLNPDATSHELAHVLALTAPEAVVTFARHRPAIEAALSGLDGPTVVDFEGLGRSVPDARRPAPHAGPPTPDTETTVLFTSGTTGRPKGVRFDHTYEVMAGEWYRTRGGRLDFRMGEERMYSPLPLFHSNTGVHAFHEMLATGGCLMTSDRFRSSRWWEEVDEARATCLHYLGVIMAMLYQLPPSEAERRHTVRFAVGAGVEPTLHAAFEERFGFPLVEVWGMTETMRYLTDNHEPRQVGTRAFGRAQPGLEARTVGDDDQPVADGTPGELVVRHSAATPRLGLFSGYLGDPEATEHAWRGGWFHTGDVAVRDPDGMFHFVDRKKHIIRRAGENIAAGEIEAALQSHPRVQQVAAVPCPDELREEEVFVCVVVEGPAEPGLADELFDHATSLLAYYKAPGFVLFVDDIPKTGSQKLKKYAIFPPGIDPRDTPGVIDLRHRKKRSVRGS